MLLTSPVCELSVIVTVGVIASNLESSFAFFNKSSFSSFILNCELSLTLAVVEFESSKSTADTHEKLTDIIVNVKINKIIILRFNLIISPPQVHKV